MRRKQSTYTAKFNPENPGIGWTQSRDFRIGKIPGIPGFRDPGINSLIAIANVTWSTFLTDVYDDVRVVVGQSDVVSPGFHDDAVNIVLIIGLRFTGVVCRRSVSPVVLLNPASSVGEPRRHLSQRHLRDDCQHHLLGFRRVRILDVLVQPGLQRPCGLPTGVLPAYIQRAVTASQWTRSSAVAERLRVVTEYFAKSLKITQGHSKLHCWVWHV